MLKLFSEINFFWHHLVGFFETFVKMENDKLEVRNVILQ